jgi:hypothetical protein
MSKSKKGYYARFYEMENYSFTPMEEVFSLDPNVCYARIYRELKKDYLKPVTRFYLSSKLRQMNVHAFFLSFRTDKRSPELTVIRIFTRFVNIRSLRIRIR